MHASREAHNRRQARRPGLRAEGAKGRSAIADNRLIHLSPTAEQCQRRFGTHPVQVCHEWNTAIHAQQAEGDPSKRAFTLDELQAFFDHANAQVARIRAAGRKGWLPAFRDAVLFKVAYAYGLRRNDARMLDVADFSRNPARFAAFRDALGLPQGLDFHSLRRSYVTHLTEQGWDALFVQHQVGHEQASTTSIYTCVSSDFRTRTLRRALDQTVQAALRSDRRAT